MIGRLWRRRAGDAGDDPPPRPDRPRADPPVCLIGDLHGRDDLLVRMIDRIGTEARGRPPRVVTLGDMIDRGPASRQVLLRLRDCADADGWTCLMGNHERMLLDFLADPVAHARWLRHGGAETMESFGCTAPPDRPRAAAADLAARLGDLTGWIAARPVLWRDGAVVAAHAGTDPARSLSDQREDALLWGRTTAPRPEAWTVHGHVVVPAPTCADGMVAVDTGAWRSGRLTAAWIDAESLRFLTVEG